MPFAIRPDDNSQIVITNVYQAVLRQSLSRRALNESLSLGYPIEVQMISMTFYDNNGVTSSHHKDISIALSGGVSRRNIIVYEEDNHSYSYYTDFNTIVIPLDMDLNFQISRIGGLNVEIVLTFKKLKSQAED